MGRGVSRGPVLAVCGVSRVYGGLDELSAQWQVERAFCSTMFRERAGELMLNWERAVRRTVAV